MKIKLEPISMKGYCLFVVEGEDEFHPIVSQQMPIEVAKEIEAMNKEIIQARIEINRENKQRFILNNAEYKLEIYEPDRDCKGEDDMCVIIEKHGNSCFSGCFPLSTMFEMMRDLACKPKNTIWKT